MIYVEACESGSIFEGVLDKSLNIYATTAANAYESSWGTYCPGMEQLFLRCFVHLQGGRSSFSNHFPCFCRHGPLAAAGVLHLPG